MKVDAISLPQLSSTPTQEFPVIKTDEIKSILYLGVRGNVQLDTGRENGKTHTIDTFA